MKRAKCLKCGYSNSLENFKFMFNKTIYCPKCDSLNITTYEVTEEEQINTDRKINFNDIALTAKLTKERRLAMVDNV
jgi:Zn finger protein HypA/HybF involved in hydrogenase expression